MLKIKDNIDLKKQLEEKQKIIDEALRLSENLKDDIRLCTDAFEEKCKRGEASYFDNDIQYYNEDIEKIVELLERGKDADS